jgi:hypothetical protein
MRELKARARGVAPSVPSDLKGRTHLVIGDTQVKPGVSTDHLGWIGRYIVDRFFGQDLVVVHLGDHWDMPSLSSYDKGKKAFEGRRYKEDIKAGNAGFDQLCRPLHRANETLAPDQQWWPERHIVLGNHEARITRAANDTPELDGLLSLDDLNAASWGWKVHEFRKPVTIDGVTYCHYFYTPNTGKPLAGENLETRLQKIGYSFTMGHQQGTKYALRPVGDRRHHGLVVGSSYTHEEEYLGPQVTKYWRGIVVCHQVEDGQYDPMFVSLDYLCRRYEGRTLADFMADKRVA